MPRSRAARTSATASRSLLPLPSPSRLLPPPPSPATETRRLVLPRVVYCIGAQFRSARGKNGLVLTDGAAVIGTQPVEDDGCDDGHRAEHEKALVDAAHQRRRISVKA